ncbi:IclR family transcriptional regulator [Pseudonocardia hispaniensis]|uniref:IclR family transcriptional regulator n=1 Tax=Pseudonocardia hispaniensis TaxID=904933 RepID=A0ABW1IZ09_9PSEU
MSNKPAAQKRDASPVQSVDRAITVLELLARDGELGVTGLAAELGVHKSTAFRLVAALEARSLVEQNAERGKYRLGVGILRLAGATAARLDLVQESRPVSRRLAAELGETINITVPSDGAALYLDQVAGSSAVQTHNWVGQRIPMHATSNGKALLAFRGDRDLTELLGRKPLTSFTEHTITNRRDLEAELDAVRELGYATAVDELEIGLTAVAAPIRNAEGVAVASLSASGPSFRLTSSRIGQIAPAVRDAADEVARRLGWHGAVL